MRSGQDSRVNASTQQGYGRLTGALDALGLRVVVVRPAAWKRDMGVSAKRDSGASPDQHRGKLKALALARAAALWPGEDFLATERSRTPHDGMFEAALIAEHLRRQHE